MKHVFLGSFIVCYAFLFSSCKTRLVRIHNEAPFICFHRECRMKKSTGLSMRVKSQRRKTSGKSIGKRRVKQKGIDKQMQANSNKVIKRNTSAKLPEKSKPDQVIHQPVKDSAKLQPAERDTTTIEVNKLSIDSASASSTFSSDKIVILFKFDEDSITKENQIKLNDYFKGKDLKNIKSIVIIGHADHDGDETYNKNLSLKRARNIYNSLRQLGVSDNKLSVKGVGELFPKASNKTTEGKEQNRSVEILLAY